MFNSPKKLSSKIPLKANNRYMVYLENRKRTYFCRVWDTAGTVNHIEFTADIGEDAVFYENFTLGKVIKQFKTGNEKEMNEFFSPRLQAELGTYLYNQIFDKWLDRKPLCNSSVELCIITKDEYLMQLPWALLADRGIFLASGGWHIFQSTQEPEGFVTFDQYPKILVILPHPQPKGYPDTKGKEHAEDMRNLLEAIAPDLISDVCFRIVHTWEELQQLNHFDPNIIYYYGHGEYKRQISKVIFAISGKTDPVSLPDFAKFLKKQAKSLQIIYFNCCSGDAAGWMGAGNQFLEAAPVVITNRTTAYIDSSRRIAINFFNDVLKAVSPAEAMNRAVLNESFDSVRYLTPVCYSRYQGWKAFPTKTEKKIWRDKDWLITLNRGEQCASLVWHTMEMVKNNKPHSLGFFWYGEAGEGVGIFHDRFRKELRKHVNKIVLLSKTLKWPDIPEKITESFEEIYRKAFNVSDLADISTSVSRGRLSDKDRTRIVLIDHEAFDILKKKERINPEILKTYLNWWSNRLIHCFSKDIYVLLGMSFIMPPEKFETFSRATGQILAESETDNFVTLFLPRLTPITPKDLETFIRTHEIPVRPDKLRQVALKILDETGGRYEATLNLLKHDEKKLFLYFDKDKPQKKSEW
jgi:predicted phosphatase